MSVRSRVAFNPHGSVNSMEHKQDYVKHLGRLQNLKKITNNMVEPRTVKHLNKDKFNGFGPRQSLDQRISFINENVNLAERITKIGRRQRLNAFDSKFKPDESSFMKTQQSVRSS